MTNGIILGICIHLFWILRKTNIDILEQNECFISKSNFNAKWEFFSMNRIIFKTYEYFYLFQIIANSIDTLYQYNAFIQVIRKINEKMAEK